MLAQKARQVRRRGVRRIELGHRRRDQEQAQRVTKVAHPEVGSRRRAAQQVSERERRLFAPRGRHLIEEGRVTVNGVPAGLGTQVNDGDDVRLDGDLVGDGAQEVEAGLHRAQQARRHHLHDRAPRRRQHRRLRRSPRARVPDRPPRQGLRGPDPAHQRRRHRQRGAARRAQPREGVRRRGRPRARRREFVERDGARAFGSPTRRRSRARSTKLGPKVFSIILTQGLNRQIRRMCEAFGYTVEALQRVRIMHIKLGQLPLGRWRNLSPQEIAPLLPRAARQPQPSPSKQGSGFRQAHDGMMTGQGNPASAWATRSVSWERRSSSGLVARGMAARFILEGLTFEARVEALQPGLAEDSSAPARSCGCRRRCGAASASASRCSAWRCASGRAMRRSARSRVPATPICSPPRSQPADDGRSPRSSPTRATSPATRTGRCRRSSTTASASRCGWRRSIR